jgi:hypothetical protein
MNAPPCYGIRTLPFLLLCYCYQHSYFMFKSFNDAINFWGYVTSFMEELVSMEHWWDDTETTKRNCLEENVSQCHFFHDKFHVDCPGIEHGLSLWEADYSPAISRHFIFVGEEPECLGTAASNGPYNLLGHFDLKHQGRISPLNPLP